MSPGFSRTWRDWVYGLVTCVTLEAVLTWLERGALVVPMSAFITSMGTLLLCDSRDAWIYAVIAALGVLSKHLIRVKGKHIFNPGNFGLVMGLLFFSGHVAVVPGRWGGGLLPLLPVSLLGVVVVWRANRLDLSATYVATFFVLAVVRMLLEGYRVMWTVYPASGAAFQLFTFFMISDPMTTPQTRRGRVIYAIVLGTLDAVLRYLRVDFAPFFALFIMCGLLPVFRRIFAPATEEVVWRTGLWRFGARQQ
jgi:Na+-transporting NADH:ubiquinone oxidoreductase subunit NqrB